MFKHAGKEFHLQAEDLGTDSCTFEVRVYDRGSVVWQKRMSYEELQQQGLGKTDFEQAVRAKMEKTLLTVEAAIVKGKIG